MSGKRKIEASETTTDEEVTTRRRTVRRHLRIEEDDDTAIMELPVKAGGWEPQHALAITGRELREQRSGQVARTLEFLEVRAHAAEHNDKYTVTEATRILRAGPGASPLELIHGRVL